MVLAKVVGVLAKKVFDYLYSAQHNNTTYEYKVQIPIETLNI